MSDTNTNFVIGEVYEIDPYIKISMNGLPPSPPYFAKLLGFSSQKQPVFESRGEFFAVHTETHKITAITKEVT